jgi:hypothetical protein
MVSPKHYLTTLHILEHVVNMKKIIIKDWSCHKLGKIANIIVLFNLYDCFFVFFDKGLTLLL